MFEIRALDKSQVTLIAEIDRSEHVTVSYIQDGEMLIEKKVDWNVPTFPLDSCDDFSVNGLLKRLEPYFERGAILLGAFDNDDLAGISVLKTDLTDTMAQLVLLHVSRKYRRMGVATQLTSEMIRLACEYGASEMYVSATPSESAVRFYMSKAFKPTANPIPHLLDLEPEDIHMIKKLR